VKKEWYLKNTASEINKCDMHLNPEMYKLLANRNIKNSFELEAYLHPHLDELIDPFLMKDMDKGVDIILTAIKKNLKIAIYSDFDADGVDAGVLLYKGLISLATTPELFIPDRSKDGYGISIRLIDEMKKKGYEVIITSDVGVSAIDAIAYAKSLGFIVVVTDHHSLSFKEVKGERIYSLPCADAIINPKQSDCPYPFKDLCGAGIALKFVMALYCKKDISLPKSLFNELLELAAVGTIGDIVDLGGGENRIIAKIGLEHLNNPTNKGFRILRECLGLVDKEITSYTIGYMYVPIINASGRLKSAQLAADILISEDENFIRERANELIQLNEQRKEFTEKGTESVDTIIKKNNYNDKYTVFVVYDDTVHESVAGIIAGRIKEKYNRPTIVLTGSSKAGIIKGSGRSIEEYNIFEEVLKIKEYTVSFGGHPMAIGMALEEKNLGIFIEKINKLSPLQNIKLVDKLIIDCSPNIRNININLVKDIKLMEPFGKGNTAPVFAKKNILIKKIFTMGTEKNHIRLICNIDGPNEFIAVGFSLRDTLFEILSEKYSSADIDKIFNNSFSKKIMLDLVFNPKINNYNDTESLQIIIKDIRLSKSPEEILENKLDKIICPIIDNGKDLIA
jgi:single-stranded-DNA-specific exonuclease